MMAITIFNPNNLPYFLETDLSKDTLDLQSPWVVGWSLGKYYSLIDDITLNQVTEFIEGFKVGCAEVADFENWHYALLLLLRTRIDLLMCVCPFIYRPFIKPNNSFINN